MMEIISNDDGNSNNNEATEKLIDDIINNKSKIIYTPICGGLAYLPVEVTDREKCDVYIGENLFIRTTFKRAKEIVKRRKQALNQNNMNKLSDDTYEIVEQLTDTKDKKESTNKANGKFNEIYIRNKLKVDELLKESKPKEEAKKELKVKSGREILRQILINQKKIINQ